MRRAILIALVALITVMPQQATGAEEKTGLRCKGYMLLGGNLPLTILWAVVSTPEPHD